MDQTTERISKYRNKYIEYPCGCRYLFDHRIVLERICTEHENELIAHHGWCGITQTLEDAWGFVAYRSNRAVPIEPIHIVSAVPSIVLGPHSTPHPSPLKMFQYRGILAKLSQTWIWHQLLVQFHWFHLVLFEPSSNLIDVGCEYLKKRDIIQANGEEMPNFSALKSSVGFVLICGLERLRIR